MNPTLADTHQPKTTWERGRATAAEKTTAPLTGRLFRHENRMYRKRERPCYHGRASPNPRTYYAPHAPKRAATTSSREGGSAATENDDRRAGVSAA